jgi:hypothetical protein
MRWIVLLQIALAGALVSREHDLSFTMKGTFTTSTRFTYNVDRPNTYSEERMIDASFGYGADVRWNILWDRFSIGLSGERITGMDRRSVYYPQYNYLAVPYEEGFDVTAVELSGYYVVPISSDRLRFYLGGGLGLYDGTRKYSIAGVKAETLGSASYMGIHVLTGIDYRLHERFGLRMEVKFRDPHFDVTSAFEQASTQYQGKLISLPQTVDVTKVNLFGVNYMGGIVVTL